MIGKSLGTLAAKILVVAVTAGVVTGGLVAAGAFSSSVQTGASVGASGVTGTVHADADEHISASVSATAKGEEEKDSDASPTASPQATSSAAAEAKDNDNAQGNENQGKADDKGHDVVNHGRCVSFAAQAADKLHLTGEDRGDFISTVARNDDAVSDTIPDGAKPDAACRAAITKAANAAKSSSVTSASVTGTVGNQDIHGSLDIVNQGHGRGGHS